MVRFADVGSPSGGRSPLFAGNSPFSPRGNPLAATRKTTLLIYFFDFEMIRPATRKLRQDAASSLEGSRDNINDAMDCVVDSYAICAILV